ncbi:hypothetical protein ACT3UD_10325 [Glutamicibacter sp. 287]|uniref:hypothetical protein n=1 Tax=Glutamicibacter sp. 287 TaxID=3457732 RepID=UPI0040348973
MTENKPRMQLSALSIFIWFAVILGLAGNTALAMTHLVLGSNALVVVSLWVLRCLVLATFWLLPITRAAKIFGIGIIMLSFLLDVLLKLPVLGSVEYGDWFFVSGLDLTGAYTGYFHTLGLILPLVALTGWFILRPRGAAGWIVGLASGLGFGFLALAAAQAPEGSLPLFVLATLARYILPALLSVAADALAARYRGKLSTKS